MNAQQLAAPRFDSPADVVAWMGAIQAQDYAGCKWAVAVRTRRRVTSDADVERALDEGTIIRTHALRWTWQLVAPVDVRWMLRLGRSRLLARAAKRYGELGLDAATLRRAATALEKALRGGAHLTRVELAQVLRAARVSPDEQRLSHILGWAEVDALICSGGRRGNQATYALLEGRVPPADRAADFEGDEALAELARRYFRGRGPATVADFSWWSGLTASDARKAIEAAGRALALEPVGGRNYWRAADAPREERGAGRSREAVLLPAFDEYLVAYRDRSAVLSTAQVRRVNDQGGMLAPVVVVGGRVLGTWRRTFEKKRVAIAISLFEPAAPRLQQQLEAAAGRYGRFLGLEAILAVRAIA